MSVSRDLYVRPITTPERVYAASRQESKRGAARYEAEPHTAQACVAGNVDPRPATFRFRVKRVKRRAANRTKSERASGRSSAAHRR